MQSRCRDMQLCSCRRDGTFTTSQGKEAVAEATQILRDFYSNLGPSFVQLRSEGLFNLYVPGFVKWCASFSWISFSKALLFERRENVVDPLSASAAFEEQ